MFCVIYRSSKRDQTYLYVEKKDDFSRVPEALMKGFGQPQLAMMLPLDGRKKISQCRARKSKTGVKRAGLLFTIAAAAGRFAETTSFFGGTKYVAR